MIAVLSDIHSNLEALEKVLEDLQNFNVREIYVLGDIVGYGPDPNPCVELVQGRKMKAIKGNHERALSDQEFLSCFNPLAAKIITWTKEDLKKENLYYLEDLPDNYIEGKAVFVHGSFTDPDKYILESQDIVEEVETLRKKNLNVEFFGHTHMKVIFMEEEKPICPQEDWVTLAKDRIFLVNPGSVGQPRDRDTAASYVIFDSEKCAILYRRVVYDMNKTIEKMKQKNFPPFTYNRLKLGI
jgi:predicted phosphodiesterase